MDNKKKDRKKPFRSGTIKTEEKIAKAKRHEDVFAIDIDPSTCSLSHIRTIVRIEAGQTLWVAYHIYRAPNGKYGVVPGALIKSTRRHFRTMDSYRRDGRERTFGQLD